METGEGIIELLDLQSQRLMSQVELSVGPDFKLQEIGLDGEGYCSFTISSPTGEGLTSPRSFSRWRRCTLVDHFRIT